MKMKRTLLLCLTLVVCAALAISGTLAYLTDTDEEVNVFTMGNVDIDLVEKFDENTANLHPGVTIEKQVWIENKGANTAYVWYTYAVPADLDNANALEIAFADQINWLHDQDFAPVVKDVLIDGVLYNVHTVLYNSILQVGTTTPVSMESVTLSGKVDYQNGEYCVVDNGVVTPIGKLDSKINVIVNAYAIQDAGFETLQAAYEAYNGQWGGATGMNAVVEVSNRDELQAALDAAVDGTFIKVTADITGDVTAVQKPDVKVVIDGNGKTFAGVLTVNGKSARYEGAGLTIQNFNFEADAISADAYIRLGGDNSMRYTNNVTVANCTFTGNGAVAVKSYTGGDWNTVIKGCTVNAGMHSLAQLTNVEKGLTITGCKVYSKNGANLNQTPYLEMYDCTFDVKGYALRVGTTGSPNAETKKFNVRNCEMKSACEEVDDAVIIFRATATNANVDLTDTTLEGDVKVLGNTEQTIINPAL